MFGVLAIYMVGAAYSLAPDAFMRGDVPGPLAYVPFAVPALYMLVIRRDSRTLPFALAGLWLSAVALIAYIGIRLSNGRIGALEGYGQLAGVLTIALIMTTVKLKDIGPKWARGTA
jgi:hypothetical protein